jgi:penicillin-binding protein 2
VKSRDTSKKEISRIKLLIFGMVLSFGFLSFKIWQIQVKQAKYYQKNEFKQSVRRVRLPGTRGRICDRNGIVMAENQPNYCIAIFLEELRRPGAWRNTVARVEELIDEMEAKLQIKPQITRKDIYVHIRKRLPLPLIVWRGLDERALARWAEQLSGMPGVGLYLEPTRYYPYNNTASHILGYVGKARSEVCDEISYHYYIHEMEGRVGIEKLYDNLLCGRAGGRLVRVDVAGFKHKDLAVREAEPGLDVVLTIDLRIQQKTEEVIKDVCGAAVVLDPKNGDVLAMASGYIIDESI